MNFNFPSVARVAVLLVAGLLATTGAVLAKDKDGKGGGNPHGQNDKHDKADKHEKEGRGDARHFEDRHRVVVNNYYQQEYRTGRCPPGLARKNNGCMPPGHDRRWTVGRPLPREVIYYSVPPALVVQLGAPQPGYRYVRVASDILMIAIGTGLVIDAIQDLERR